MPSATHSDHFTVVEIASGVYALIADPGGTAISNTAIIDMGDRTLVVDSFQTLEAGDDLLAACQALTGRSAAVLVNTHWHSDHIGGNQLFAGADIVSTRRTVELISEHNAADLTTLEAEIQGYVEWAREAVAAAESESEQGRAERALRMATSLQRELPRFSLTLPNLTLEDDLHVHGRDRAAVVTTFGGGHTESDVFVTLPAEGIMVLGDLLWTDLHPRANDGDPAAWAAILDRIAAMEPKLAVAGHGDVAGRATPQALAAYLRDLDDLVTEAVAAGWDDDTLDRLPVPSGSGRWDGAARFADSVKTLAARRRNA